MVRRVRRLDRKEDIGCVEENGDCVSNGSKWLEEKGDCIGRRTVEG
jgi:hypothetical protein